MKSPSFYVLVMWTALSLLAMTIVACIYPFGKTGTQVVCRAYPSQYAAWQYAPAGQTDSEHRWVEDCQEADLFYQAYAAIWQTYETDSTSWCVACTEIPNCPEEFNSCK